jgi:uncharacterized membrane protein
VSLNLQELLEALQVSPFSIPNSSSSFSSSHHYYYLNIVDLIFFLGLSTIMVVYFTLFKRISPPKLVIQLELAILVIPSTSNNKP